MKTQYCKGYKIHNFWNGRNDDKIITKMMTRIFVKNVENATAKVIKIITFTINVKEVMAYVNKRYLLQWHKCKMMFSYSLGKENSVKEKLIIS